MTLLIPVIKAHTIAQQLRGEWLRGEPISIENFFSATHLCRILDKSTINNQQSFIRLQVGNR